MTKRMLLTTLAGLAACTAIVPASASAAPTYGTAAFKVDLRGTQVTTWEYHHDTLKDGVCNGSKVDSYGDQTLKWKSGPKGRLLIGKPAGGKPTLALMQDTKAFAFWQVGVDAHRTGTRVVAEVDRSTCEGANGGGVPPRRPEDKDCGMRWGTLVPQLEATGRGRVTLVGETQKWSADDLLVPIVADDGDGASLDETYRDCEYWEGGPTAPEARDELLPATERLPIAAMLNPRRRKIVIDFGRVQEHRDDAFTGKTIVAGKLTLTRTKLVPAG